MLEIIPNWHPIFVHFTVTLVTLVGIMQLISWLSKNDSRSEYLAKTLKWLVALTAFSVIATIATGLVAYGSVAHDAPSHAVMTNHRNWALATASIFILGTVMFYLFNKKLGFVAGLFFVTATAMVAITGFKGGEIVYRYGLGVMSLPAASEEGESHSHDASNAHSDDKAQTTATVTSEEAKGHAHDASNAHSETSKTQTAPPQPAGDGHSHSHEQSGAENSAQSIKKNALFIGQGSEAGMAVKAFRQALRTDDAELAASLLDDNVVIFEGGGIERSAKEYASHHMLSDMAFLKEMTITPLEQQVKTNGNSAIAFSRSKLNGKYKGKELDIQSIETLYLEKGDSGWKITHIHWSNKK